MSRVEFAEIRVRLLLQVEQLVRELVPDGKVSGSYWIGRNPTRADRHAGSFWVRIREPAAGAWRDEAGVRGVDDGDVVDLVRYCMGHRDLSETRVWCLRWLGLADGAAGGPNRAELERRRRAFEERRQREAVDEAKRRAENRRRAFGLWLHAQDLTPASFPGSIVDRYLKSRAIDLVARFLERGRPLPGAIRFLPVHDYRTADGEIFELPCMVALMTGPDGKPWGVHRTWLEPDGSGKARLPDPQENKPRKIWPAGWNGAVIRLAKGAGNHTPEEAARRGLTQPLIVGEGIEDGLTAAILDPDARVWAAGTLGNMGLVPVEHPCVARVTVLADNDWSAQAQKQLERAVAAMRAKGRLVAVARSPRGKDFNDLLMGEPT